MVISAVDKEHKIELIQIAKARHVNIFPIKAQNTLLNDENFTIIKLSNSVQLVYWYNTADESTHIAQKIICD